VNDKNIYIWLFTFGDVLVFNVYLLSKSVLLFQDDEAAKAEKAEDEDSVQSEDIANTRPRSNSGRFLTDTEILEQVSVLNLDTGEKIPLSLAEDKIPRCMNPLSLHIMRRTKEYSRYVAWPSLFRLYS
jgi:hypothetical protein